MNLLVPKLMGYVLNLRTEEGKTKLALDRTNSGQILAPKPSQCQEPTNSMTSWYWQCNMNANYVNAMTWNENED